MKKILIAAISLSLLTGTIVLGESTSTTKSTAQKEKRGNKNKQTSSMTPP